MVLAALVAALAAAAPASAKIVEVPEDSVDHVIQTLRGTTIKGKKATIRRERFTGPRR